jgi:hypothetical protein
MLQWHSKLFDCIIAYMYKPNKQTFSSFFCIFWKKHQPSRWFKHNPQSWRWQRVTTPFWLLTSHHVMLLHNKPFWRYCKQISLTHKLQRCWITKMLKVLPNQNKHSHTMSQLFGANFPYVKFPKIPGTWAPHWSRSLAAAPLSPSLNTVATAPTAMALWLHRDQTWQHYLEAKLDSLDDRSGFPKR